MTEPMIEATEAEIEEFTDELTDEALDREDGRTCMVTGGTAVACCGRGR